jgi:hypothetical protein
MRAIEEIKSATRYIYIPAATVACNDSFEDPCLLVVGNISSPNLNVISKWPFKNSMYLNSSTVTIFYLRSNPKMLYRIPQKFYGTFIASSLWSHQCASGLQKPESPALRDGQ